MFQRRIEEAALNAWPALQQILFDGWILRFSKGYTKRANSVNPLYASRLDVGEKVDACEKLYAEKGLRPVFRLTPFSSPPDLDQVLVDGDRVALFHLNSMWPFQYRHGVAMGDDLKDTATEDTGIFHHRSR